MWTSSAIISASALIDHIKTKFVRSLIHVSFSLHNKITIFSWSVKSVHLKHSMPWKQIQKNFKHSLKCASEAYYRSGGQGWSPKKTAVGKDREISNWFRQKEKKGGMSRSYILNVCEQRNKISTKLIPPQSTKLGKRSRLGVGVQRKSSGQLIWDGLSVGEHAKT